MGTMSPSVNEGFERLQRLLLAMEVGDDLAVSDAVQVSGLTQHTCLAVLEGLTRAGLMTHEADDRFTRRALDVMTS